jgi:hypothetical protein
MATGAPSAIYSNTRSSEYQHPQSSNQRPGDLVISSECAEEEEDGSSGGQVCQPNEPDVSAPAANPCEFGFDGRFSRHSCSRRPPNFFLDRPV